MELIAGTTAHHLDPTTTLQQKHTELRLYRMPRRLDVLTGRELGIEGVFRVSEVRYELQKGSVFAP